MGGGGGDELLPIYAGEDIWSENPIFPPPAPSNLPPMEEEEEEEVIFPLPSPRGIPGTTVKEEGWIRFIIFKTIVID